MTRTFAYRAPVHRPSCVRRRRSLACLSLAVSLTVAGGACGDDGGEEGGGTGSVTETSAPGPSSGSTSMQGSSGPADGSSGGNTTGATGDGSISDGATSDGATSDGATTGAAEDPVYPRPEGNNCPGGTAPITLPQSVICAPFCAGRGDVCPAPAGGDAPAQCIPFLGNGGSGDLCDDMTPCGPNEGCDMGGMCVEISFWACQLVCADGQSCPDGMICNGINTCGYPGA
ncbi:MAG: hypothetical protein AAGF11_47945 [Myxococcota bacterium]